MRTPQERLNVVWATVAGIGFYLAILCIIFGFSIG